MPDDDAEFEREYSGAASKRPKVKVDVTVDNTGGWPFTILAMVMAYLLCTNDGNKSMCRYNWQPTFIDCAKVK